MSKSAMQEYVRRMRERYAGMTTKKAKSRVLSEFCDTSGYERKHANKLLISKAGVRQRKAGESLYITRRLRQY